jgi:hypothetical protein
MAPLISLCRPVSFTRAFTYQLYSLGLLDQTFAVRIDPSLSSASPSRLQTEAREAGVDFGVSYSRCVIVIKAHHKKVALSQSEILL